MERHLRSKLANGTFAGVSTTRSHIMGAIKSKSNASTEVALRLALVRAGIAGWRLHARDVPGRPDFYFDGARVAVFVDGCFWHGCAKCGHIPKTRSEFWRAKFLRNKARDRKTNRLLRASGVEVVRVWEHSLKGPAALTKAVKEVRGAVAARAES
jgi:DNA mismatch endonuclease (patch repair protein)